jgi:glycerophosphoryl diester phosphodiesterase
VFFGFWNRFQLRNFRKTCPEMKIKMKIARKASLPRLIRKYNPGIAEIPYRKIDSGIIEACHDAGIMVMVYQKKNDAEKYRKIAASGVDIINLNHIELFRAVVSDID